MKYRTITILGAMFALVATTAFAEKPFKVLFDFGRLSGDRDQYFGERQSTNTFDVNGAAATTLSVVNAGYLNTQNKTSVWLVLNDTNPDVLDTSAATNVNDLQAGTNVIARSRIQYLYASVNAVTNEAVSAGILFGLTGTGNARTGYLARVERVNTAIGGNFATLFIDEFTNGVRGATLAASSGFVYGANSSLHFLELRITSDGTSTNVTFKVFADADIPNAAGTTNVNRLIDPAFDSATPEATVTVGLPNYKEGFLALYGEDNSNKTDNNPTADIIRFSNFYAKSGVLPSTVTVVATDNSADENGDLGTFEFTRAFPDVVTTNVALTLDYEVSGTASNGADYPLLTGQITIPVGSSNVTLTITPTDDSESELAETLTVTLLPGDNYIVETPDTATMTILDNDPTKIGVYTSRNFAYEPIPQLYAEFTLVRYGLTSTAPTVNVSYSGSAASGVDFTAATSASFGAGEITKTITVTPIDNSVYAGDKSVILTVDSGAGYTPATDNTATATIVDDEYPAETVLWSDDFNSSYSDTNYTLIATALVPPDDYTTNFFFDYLNNSFPPARNGSTNYGLLLSANKDGVIGSPACINLYPVGQNFSNNFALRFNLLVQYEDVTGNQENVLFGINHSGLATNFISGSYSNVLRGDGIWVAVSTMLNGPGSVSATVYASQNVGDAPVAVAQPLGTDLAQILPSPPFTVLGGMGIDYTSPNKTWVDVELSQVDSVISLRLNHTLVFQSLNATAFTNGNIMLGYDDAFNSVGSPYTYALFDNVRVVQLASAAAPVITAINVSGGNVDIDFTGSAGDTTGSFKLLNTSVLTSGYTTNLSAVITSLGGTSFRASTSTSGTEQFYRIQRQY